MEIFRGRRLWIENRLIRLPNGIEREKVIVHPSNAVAILPLDGDQCKLVKQYRYAIDQYILEAPAGTMETGEDPMQTAHRELIEETGYRGNRFEKLGAITPSPGYSDERIHIFLATDLVADRQNLDRDEVLHVHAKPFDEALEMACNGNIVDAKTIAALFLAQKYLAGR